MKFSSWLLSAFLFLSPIVCVAAAPTENVRATVDAVLMVLKDEAKEMDAKKTEIRNLLSKRFDYRAMSQRTLATNWRTASKEEQDKFTELYTRMLQETYLVMVEEYTNEEVSYKNETIKKEKYGEVETAILMPDKEIPVVYKTIRGDDGEWYIYDVVIEGVSLISNYRSSYGAIAKKEGVAGLIGKLEAKLNGA